MGKTFKLLLLAAGCAAAIFLPIHFSYHPYAARSFVPHLLGIIGSAMVACGAVFYALRKRIKAMKNLGKMKYWLEVHILFCLVGPLLIVYHSAFKVLAPNSAVSFYVMMTIVASGVVGRYIYRHFQFTLSGERVSLKEMNEEAEKMDKEIKERLSGSRGLFDTVSKFSKLKEGRTSGGLLKSLFVMIRLDFVEKRLRRQIRKQMRGAGRPDPSRPFADRGSIEAALIRRINLAKNISALEATTRLFSFWHKLHVPLVWILIITFIAHIAAVMIF
jgi:hypothetical protein